MQAVISIIISRSNVFHSRGFNTMLVDNNIKSSMVDKILRLMEITEPLEKTIFVIRIISFC